MVQKSKTKVGRNTRLMSLSELQRIVNKGMESIQDKRQWTTVVSHTKSSAYKRRVIEKRQMSIDVVPEERAAKHSSQDLTQLDSQSLNKSSIKDYRSSPKQVTP